VESVLTQQDGLIRRIKDAIGMSRWGGAWMAVLEPALSGPWEPPFCTQRITAAFVAKQWERALCIQHAKLIVMTPALMDQIALNWNHFMNLIATDASARPAGEILPTI
jgi:hypothetical protein